MLVGIRNVDVQIEPDQVIAEALQEGSLSIGSVIGACIGKGGVDEVLKAFDDDAIIEYVQRYNLRVYIGGIEDILAFIGYLNETEKAKLLWHLLNCTKEKQC